MEWSQFQDGNRDFFLFLGIRFVVLILITFFYYSEKFRFVEVRGYVSEGEIRLVLNFIVVFVFVYQNQMVFGFFLFNFIYSIIVCGLCNIFEYQSIIIVLFFWDKGYFFFWKYRVFIVLGQLRIIICLVEIFKIGSVFFFIFVSCFYVIYLWFGGLFVLLFIVRCFLRGFFVFGF